VLVEKCHWLAALVSAQIFEPCFSRGCAARCAEVAMPFRELLDFYPGYAPTVWRAERQEKGFLLDPGAMGA
jgi:hypothetical protein